MAAPEPVRWVCVRAPNVMRDRFRTTLGRHAAVARVEEVVDSSPECLLIAELKDDVVPLEALKSLTAWPGVSRTATRFYLATHLVPDLAALVTALTTGLGGQPPAVAAGSGVRLQVYSKTLQEQLAVALDDHHRDHLRLRPVGFDAVVLAVQRADGHIGYAVQPAADFIHILHEGSVEKPVPEAPCRAYFKLPEAVLHFPKGLWPPGKAMRCLDIGASPGGWTAYLAEQEFVEHVVAVDPGKLLPKILALPKVRYVGKKLEDGLDEVAALGPYDMLVCDVNVDPRDTSRSLIMPTARLLRPGALVVLTVKMRRSANDLGIENYLRDTALVLQPGFELLSVCHLHANSTFERTLLARRNDDPDPPMPPPRAIPTGWDDMRREQAERKTARLDADFALGGFEDCRRAAYALNQAERDAEMERRRKCHDKKEKKWVAKGGAGDDGDGALAQHE